MYTPWLTQVQSYRCPSDPIVHAGQAQTNYATCYGDAVRYVGANYGGATGSVPQDDGCKRGVFTRNYFFRFRDILDGTSNTIAMGEICVGDGSDRLAKAHILLDDGANFTSSQTIRTNPSLCLRGPHIDSSRPQFLTTAGTNFIRGRRWADGHYSYTSFQTILPPNSPNCRQDTLSHFSGVMSAASQHQGGAHVLMADGAVKFITDSIDTNNTGLISVSSFIELPIIGLLDHQVPTDFGVLWERVHQKRR